MRLEREARRRGLPLSTAVRVLAVERMRELEEAAELSAADQWQRAQAWREWERVRAGDASEVTHDELMAEFRPAARRRVRQTRKQPA